MRWSRLSLRSLLVLVAATAVALAWGVHAWRRHLADDSGRFYTHEEWAVYQAFQEAAATAIADECERKAADGGPDADHWRREAAGARNRASAAARAKQEYEWRASLKNSRW
jgi:hypothetical protein